LSMVLSVCVWASSFRSLSLSQWSVRTRRQFHLHLLSRRLPRRRVRR
jgi:hypothetical protein